jgi:hypothetical protein
LSSDDLAIWRFGDAEVSGGGFAPCARGRLFYVLFGFVVAARGLFRLHEYRNQFVRFLDQRLGGFGRANRAFDQ